MALDTNSDFLNQKKDSNEIKPKAKKHTEKKKKDSNSVLVFSRILSESEKINTREKYDFVISKIKQIENREIDEKYKEYKSLNDYSKNCLVATNYWRIMWGKAFIDVPPQDVRFWFYFNVRCFDDALRWQKTRKPEFEEKNRCEEEKHKLLDEKNNNVKDSNPINEPVTEVKIVSEKKEEDMPIEENKDFLNQKQEHPTYLKKEKPDIKNEEENNNTVLKTNIEPELKPETKAKSEPEKNKKNQKSKTKTKPNDDTQYNLF